MAVLSGGGVPSSRSAAERAARRPIRRALLIVNPASRRAARLHGRAAAALRAHGLEVEVCLTERPGHARELALARCGEFDAVFALGGDGTAMEVAGALVGRNVPLGVLAGGTGNLLARALGIPLRVEKAVAALLDGDMLACDLGRFEGGQRFAVAAGVGIDARMVSLAPAVLKRRLGVLAYWLAGARAAFGSVLSRGGRFRVRLTVDGEVTEGEAVMAMVANFGAVLDELITFGPGIRYDDGVLDAVVYSPRTLPDAVGIMWRLLRKDFRSSPHVLYRSGRHIRIETFPPQPVQADGELLGHVPFDVTAEPHAALVLIPKR
jgi:YegS/Rv2252/BmrU family lipid kinase